MSIQNADDHGWRSDAACLQYPPEMFYPEKNEAARAARRVCLSCPVAEQCIDTAIANHDYWGIHGGLTEKPLRRYAATLRRTAA